MKDLKYEKIADFHKASESRGKNALIAFLSGGVMGLLAEGIMELLISTFHFTRDLSATYMIILFIFLLVYLQHLDFLMIGLLS